MSSNESNESNFEQLNNTNREQNGEQIEGFDEFELNNPGGSTLSNSGLNNQQNNAPESQENHEQEIPQSQPEKVDIIIEKKENYILKEKYFKQHAENQSMSQILPQPELINKNSGRSPIIDYFEIEKMNDQNILTFLAPLFPTGTRQKLKRLLEKSNNYVKKGELALKMKNSESRQINRFQNTDIRFNILQFF